MSVSASAVLLAQPTPLVLAAAAATPSPAPAAATSSTASSAATASSAPTASSSVPASPTPTPAAVDHLQNSWAALVVGITVVFVLLAGVVVWFARGGLAGKSGSRAAGAAANNGDGQPGVPNVASDNTNPPDPTLVRSWLAISLVGGLLIFCAASFALDDTTLRSTLIGGLVASAGSAVAFYFSSKEAAQARQDVINASGAGKPVAVPNLMGMDRDGGRSGAAQPSPRGALQPHHARRWIESHQPTTRPEQSEHLRLDRHGDLHSTGRSSKPDDHDNRSGQRRTCRASSVGRCSPGAAPGRYDRSRAGAAAGHPSIDQHKCDGELCLIPALKPAAGAWWPLAPRW